MEFNTSLVEYILWVVLVIAVIVFCALLFLKVLFSGGEKYDMAMDEMFKKNNSQQKS